MGTLLTNWTNSRFVALAGRDGSLASPLSQQRYISPHTESLFCGCYRRSERVAGKTLQGRYDLQTASTF